MSAAEAIDGHGDAARVVQFPESVVDSHETPETVVVQVAATSDTPPRPWAKALLEKGRDGVAGPYGSTGEPIAFDFGEHNAHDPAPDIYITELRHDSCLEILCADVPLIAVVDVSVPLRPLADLKGLASVQAVVAGTFSCDSLIEATESIRRGSTRTYWGQSVRPLLPAVVSPYHLERFSLRELVLLDRYLFGGASKTTEIEEALIKSAQAYGKSLPRKASISAAEARSWFLQQRRKELNSRFGKKIGQLIFADTAPKSA